MGGPEMGGQGMGGQGMGGQGMGGPGTRWTGACCGTRAASCRTPSGTAG